MVLARIADIKPHFLFVFKRADIMGFIETQKRIGVVSIPEAGGVGVDCYGGKTLFFEVPNNRECLTLQQGYEWIGMGRE